MSNCHVHNLSTSEIYENSGIAGSSSAQVQAGRLTTLQFMAWLGMFPTYRRLYAPLSREIHSFVQNGTKSLAAIDGFTFFPDFLSLTEQRTLLSAALSKLDSTGTKQARKRQRDFLANHPRESRGIEDVFLPEAYYDFEEVAYRLYHKEPGS